MESIIYYLYSINIVAFVVYSMDKLLAKLRSWALGIKRVEPCGKKKSRNLNCNKKLLKSNLVSIELSVVLIFNAFLYQMSCH